MYASTRIHEGVTDPQEVARRAREGFVPLVSSIEGFVGSDIVFDPPAITEGEVVASG